MRESSGCMISHSVSRSVSRSGRLRSRTPYLNFPIDFKMNQSIINTDIIRLLIAGARFAKSGSPAQTTLPSILRCTDEIAFTPTLLL